MLCCVDVDYRGSDAVAAGVLFSRWTDGRPAREIRATIRGIEPYVPGEFYRRELPCILRVLEGVHEPLDAVVIDGYVWLDSAGRPGLGARLYEAIERRAPVVGVAKTAFHGVSTGIEVLRGRSASPLFVTAAGMEAEEAARLVRSMHGEHRIPTLLKAADRLCRQP
jgi:deoxyribonuclease V